MNSPFSPLPSPSRAGFSLVEVTLAIGVAAVAIVSLLALLPVGLGQAREAIDTTVTAQIATRLANDAQQTDFDTLTAEETGKPPSDKTFRQSAIRYFDDQGAELPVTRRREAIYHSVVRVVPASPLPVGATTPDYNPDLATIAVQIVYNPGDQPLEFHPEGGPEESERSFVKARAGQKVATYGFAIARNERRHPKP